MCIPIVQVWWSPLCCSCGADMGLGKAAKSRDCYHAVYSQKRAKVASSRRVLAEGGALVRGLQFGLRSKPYSSGDNEPVISSEVAAFFFCGAKVQRCVFTPRIYPRFAINCNETFRTSRQRCGLLPIKLGAHAAGLEWVHGAVSPLCRLHLPTLPRTTRRTSLPFLLPWAGTIFLFSGGNGVGWPCREAGTYPW